MEPTASYRPHRPSPPPTPPQVWRGLGATVDHRAPQLSPPQWQLLRPQHLAACDDACAAAAAADATVAADADADAGAGAGAEPGAALLQTLRHLCAYHDCPLRPEVVAQLRAQLGAPPPATPTPYPYPDH